MSIVISDLLELGSVIELLRSEGVLFLLVSLFMIYVAKVVHDLLSPYNLAKELTGHDNKAVALSFAGYIYGVGLILFGVITNGGEESVASLSTNIISVVGWGTGGILFLILARLINDNILLRNFCNTKELVEDRNVGTGAVECGSFIGSALIIHAALTGEDRGLVAGIVSTVIYFIMGQIGFLIFGFLYGKTLRFDLHDEIEKDNVSAGVSFGFNLVAIGLLLSGFIKHSDSITGFFIWLIFTAFLLFSSRYLVDKFILPGDLLDEEISRDHNWGASLVEGASAILIALIVNASFF